METNGSSWCKVPSAATSWRVTRRCSACDAVGSMAAPYTLGPRRGAGLQVALAADPRERVEFVQLAGASVAHVDAVRRREALHLAVQGGHRVLPRAPVR